MSATEHPTVIDADFVQHLHERYAALREAGPAHRVRTSDGLPVWVVTRYADVRAALADPRLSKDVDGARRIVQDKLPNDQVRGTPDDAIAKHMLNLDPPDHTRIRKLVVKAFTARRVDELCPRVEWLTARLLDAFGDRDEVDLLDALAFPLPIQVICELLGVDEAHREDFRTWTNTLLDASDRGAAAAAAADLSGYLGELVARKRAEPDADLVSGLIEASEDADRLSRDELISMVFLLLIAGHETTVNLIGNAVLALLAEPGRWRELHADPGLVEPVVEEALRFDSPVMHGTFRHTVQPVDIGGVEIPAHEVVWVSIASANRDPQRFGEPDRFDPRREAQGHLAFGHGIHFCLGAQLARLEGRTALRQLSARFPGLRAAPALREPQWRYSTLIRGLRELPVLLR
ncbi:cytochrome P450 [Saccharopolyspora sp. HNM0983]|uniref:Cytochrome P450 n=1 Tax=Saccharopolyspora montiporae TaxID=2781240 RepID=A0A929FZ66_9PSEU|nr:cytochrome P450 [Saccharopolyspora sp. HNM0983]MBE9374240.1 cytochrome P450 [Saccharopolyspora sp. HNM0983]